MIRSVLMAMLASAALTACAPEVEAPADAGGGVGPPDPGGGGRAGQAGLGAVDA